ncbi:MAG: hypothetical protein A2Y10_12650 [Planctomycetes bacterium GWF2_41_51]|nr:MAG: hypothetical protein A2Y10_12650 [Planctomycetes bacterium GWF2_41_51]
MRPLFSTDYEIDVIFGKLAASCIMLLGINLVWKSLTAGKFYLSPIFFAFAILVPCTYLFSLITYRIKLAKLAFQIWTVFILLLFFSQTNRILNKFSSFWAGILPYALVTVCMLIGLKGIGRIKDGNQFDIDKTSKIPESYRNLRILVGSVDGIISLLSTFIIMVLAGKYFHDFALANWPSFGERKILLFCIGVGVGYYPSRIMGAVISCIFTFLVNSSYKYYAESK